MAAVLCLGAGGGALAQVPEDDEDAWGDVDFDDMEIPDIQVAPPSPWSVRGFVRSGWGVWTERLDDAALARGRQSLDLVMTRKEGGLRVVLAGHGEVDLAYLEEGDDVDAATQEVYGWQLLGRDMFAAWSAGSVDLTFGRQIVTWGEGDMFSPLDVVNPRDMREPGLADLDDIRMPVLASRVGLFVGDHRFEAMVIHEADFGLQSPPFGPYSPLPELLADDPAAASALAGKVLRFRHKQERFDLGRHQPLARWVYKGPGIDLGLYGAWVMDQQGVIGLDLTDAAALTEFALDPEPELELDHRYHGVVGTSGAWAWRSVLLKWELGAKIGRSLNTMDESAALPAFGITRATSVETMLGVTWTPEPEWVCAVEVAKPWLLDEPDDLLMDVDVPVLALRAMWRTWNDRLVLQGAATILGARAEQGWLARVEASWEARESLFVGLGLVTYHPGDDFGFLSGLTRHDQGLLRLRWDFTIL